MNCNLRVQAGPESKVEVTSPSASREKWILTEDTLQKHGYIISSYKLLPDLFFLYFDIGPNNNKTKINNQKKKKKKKKNARNFFCKPLFNTDFIFVLQGSLLRLV